MVWPLNLALADWIFSSLDIPAPIVELAMPDTAPIPLVIAPVIRLPPIIDFIRPGPSPPPGPPPPDPLKGLSLEKNPPTLENPDLRPPNILENPPLKADFKGFSISILTLCLLPVRFLSSLSRFLASLLAALKVDKSILKLLAEEKALSSGFLIDLAELFILVKFDFNLFIALSFVVISIL